MAEKNPALAPVTLNLFTIEANLILKVLYKHPFEEVEVLINKIKEQAIPQFEAWAAANMEKE